jgi:hypothetical protein
MPMSDMAFALASLSIDVDLVLTRVPSFGSR